MKRSREPEEDPESASPAAEDSPSASDDLISLPVSKVSQLESGNVAIMKCSLPPHKEPVDFSSYEDYESHYNQAHTNRCTECRKNFPSPHLLDLHIEECHDAFLALKREKGERTFSCFVEGCERKCSTPQKRRMHLIDKHLYPRNFFFAITRDGIDGRQSLLTGRGHQRRRSSAANNNRAGPSSPGGRAKKTQPDARPGESSKGEDDDDDDTSDDDTSESDADGEMDELAGAMSALRFVPTSVRFGRKAGGKVGFAKK